MEKQYNFEQFKGYHGRKPKHNKHFCGLRIGRGKIWFTKKFRDFLGFGVGDRVCLYFDSSNKKAIGLIKVEGLPKEGWHSGFEINKNNEISCSINSELPLGKYYYKGKLAGLGEMLVCVYGK